MAELKPCPFCGRRPSKVREHKAVSISTVFYNGYFHARAFYCNDIGERREGE